MDKTDTTYQEKICAICSHQDDCDKDKFIKVPSRITNRIDYKCYSYEYKGVK